jgi:hypothetical protein
MQEVCQGGWFPRTVFYALFSIENGNNLFYCCSTMSKSSLTVSDTKPPSPLDADYALYIDFKKGQGRPRAIALEKITH